MKKTSILIFFALASFASVLFCTITNANAQTVAKPWDVDVFVCHDGKSVRYVLSQNVQRDCINAGYYLGAKGKIKLYKQLQKMQLPTEAIINYLLPNFNDVISQFDSVNRQKVDATLNFSKQGFNYTKGCDGVCIDKDKLLLDALGCAGLGSKRVSLPLVIRRAITVEQLQSNAVLKGKFTTTFNGSGQNRCHNIGVAVNALNGTCVPPNGVFSFNDVVGARTLSQGYKQAKIIVGGKYVDGVGGGVCQVSTTLYNALLLANFLPKATAHTLVSGYVLAGFDAMVSYGASDLTFVNDTPFPLYVCASVQGKSVTVSVYGAPNEYQIVRKNVEVRTPYKVIEQVADANEYPQLVYTDQRLVTQNGSDGVKTQSYLLYYKQGNLVQTKLIRVNNYKLVNKIVLHGANQRLQRQTTEHLTE